MAAKAKSWKYDLSKEKPETLSGITAALLLWAIAFPLKAEDRALYYNNSLFYFT